MRVSLNWLRELIPALDLSAAEIGDKLTALGLELEGSIKVGAGLDAVEICEVRSVEPHPNRDRLQLVTVARKGTEQRVVCGAANVPQPGGSVVLAPLGSTLPAVGLTLEPRKLGGVVSEGMLCSETELGLGAGANGILTFAAGRFATGTRFLDAFPFAEDTVFELGITPNRPDALGHIGVARDLAALLNLNWSPPSCEPASDSNSNLDERLDDLIEIDNLATEYCPRYGAAIVREVSVHTSPEWLRWRLSALGIRPISNVVDITNLLLMEFGNPMHAFDLTRIRGRKIIIRHARAGEPMTTLDGVDRELLATDLVIGDSEGPSALAGVMGGADSEIRDQTTDVLLECAYFNPRGIRRTARRLGLHSDSSFRFERGVDWAALPAVLGRASQLLCELAGARAVNGQRFADGALPELPTIPFRHRQLERLLGCEIDFPEALALLERLGFAVLNRDATAAELRGASWRPDVTLEADLIEEVARLRGLDAIPTVLPRIAPQTPTPAGRLEREARHAASSIGLFEAIGYSFVSAADLETLRAPAPIVILKSPLSSERSVMTTSLLPGLLEAVKRARRRGENDVRLFTVASRFLTPSSTSQPAQIQAARPRVSEDAGRLPEERLSFAAVLTGRRPTYLKAADPLDEFDAKGVAVRLIEQLTGRTPSTLWGGPPPSPTPHLHPRSAGLLTLDDLTVGCFGPLHPDICDSLELGGPVQIVELDLAALETIGRAMPKYRPVPRLPAVTRDIALEVDSSINTERLTEAIASGAGELCESVTLFDLFESKQLGPGHRSLAFRVVYRDPRATTHPDEAKTLTDKQVDQQHAKVVAAVQQLGATLRA
jgi:phenylalanyl-tRNA synthetase beta chain